MEMCKVLGQSGHSCLYRPCKMVMHAGGLTLRTLGTYWWILTAHTQQMCGGSSPALGRETCGCIPDFSEAGRHWRKMLSRPSTANYSRWAASTGSSRQYPWLDTTATAILLAVPLLIIAKQDAQEHHWPWRAAQPVDSAEPPAICLQHAVRHFVLQH